MWINQASDDLKNFWVTPLNGKKRVATGDSLSETRLWRASEDEPVDRTRFLPMDGRTRKLF